MNSLEGYCRRELIKFKFIELYLKRNRRKAIENGQNVLYITERCVFALRPEGLALTEVYPGIDKQKDILDKLPFPVLDETGQ